MKKKKLPMNEDERYHLSIICRASKLGERLDSEQSRFLQEMFARDPKGYAKVQAKAAKEAEAEYKKAYTLGAE